MPPPDSRPMSHSVGSITTFVMPHMQNVRGDLFGGELMALVDEAAAVAAIRHAGGPAVTASIDRVDFRERIPVGRLVTCTASVDYVGNSSMDISVEVYSEQVSTGSGGTRIRHTWCSWRSTRRGSRSAFRGHSGDRRGAGAVRPGGGAPKRAEARVSGPRVTVVLSGGGAKSTPLAVWASRALEEAGLRSRVVRHDVHRVGRRRFSRPCPSPPAAQRITQAAPRRVARCHVTLAVMMLARALLRPARRSAAPCEQSVRARRFADLPGSPHLVCGQHD